MEEEPVYEMKLTKGTKEELEKAQDYIVKVMKERLDELNRR